MRAIYILSFCIPFLFYKFVPYHGPTYEEKVMEVERQRADERLLDFIYGHSKFVDESDLQIGSDYIVERAWEKLD
jgi:hypothetical protein